MRSSSPRNLPSSFLSVRPELRNTYPDHRAAHRTPAGPRRQRCTNHRSNRMSGTQCWPSEPLSAPTFLCPRFQESILARYAREDGHKSCRAAAPPSTLGTPDALPKTSVPRAKGKGQGVLGRTQTNRKPRLTRRKSGAPLLRLAERQRPARSSQEPPRNTRRSPEPLFGSVTIL